MNPQVNTEKLRHRLWLIDHYKYRYGAQHTYWVNAAMRKYGSQLWKYKFNYGLKAAGAVMVWNRYQYYQKQDEERFLTDTERYELAGYTSAYAIGLAGLCCII